MNIKSPSMPAGFDHPIISVFAKKSVEAIIILDKYTNIVLFNPKAEFVFGLPANEAIGMEMTSLCQHLSINNIFNPDLETILEHTASSAINSIIFGKKIVWEVIQIEYLQGHYTIFMSQGLMDTETRDDNCRLETLIDNMPCNVYWMDNNCRMLGCNQNVLSMLNMSREQFVGKTYEELSLAGNWPDGLAQKLKNDDLMVMRTGCPMFGVEDPPIPHANQSILNLLTSRVPLKNRSGDIIGVAGISVDISELKRAREVAEAANKSRDEFIANMSHDIRTPLSGVVGLSRLLEEGAETFEQKQYAHWINACGEQLLELLNSILDVASVENINKHEGINEAFDLRKLLNDIAALEIPTIRLRQLDLAVHVDEEIPVCLKGDSRKLHRILLNLLGNAIKFTEKGFISITVKLVGRYHDRVELEFAVEDTGKGIAADMQEKVFDRFFRIDPSFKGNHRGHGIGLHIVRKYVELLGGHIQLHSTLGKGSRFCFTLSLLVGEPGMLSTRSESLVQTLTSQSESIIDTDYAPYLLLVEDNIVALRLIEAMVVQAGCRYISSSNGEQALELARSIHFDMIFTDIGLPGISGIQLTSALREWEQSQNKQAVPIIGLTAQMGEKVEQICLLAGMNKVLAKPARHDEVNRLIDEFARLTQTA